MMDSGTRDILLPAAVSQLHAEEEKPQKKGAAHRPSMLRALMFASASPSTCS
jgi:hypothetical protein